MKLHPVRGWSYHPDWAYPSLDLPFFLQEHHISPPWCSTLVSSLNWFSSCTQRVSPSAAYLSVWGWQFRREGGWGTAALATANNNAKKITNLKNRRDGRKLGMYTASAGPLPWIVFSLTSSSLHFPSCIWSVIQKHKTQISQVDHLLVSGNYKRVCFKINNKITLRGQRPPEWKIKYFVLFKVGFHKL